MVNAENIKKWVAALRSGEYKQGLAALRIGDTFCCLGVACDLFAKAKPSPENVWELGRQFHGSEQIMSDDVADWLGLQGEDRCNPYMLLPQSGPGELINSAPLAKINDEGVSFAGIADLIEQQILCPANPKS